MSVPVKKLPKSVNIQWNYETCAAYFLLTIQRKLPIMEKKQHGIGIIVNC